MMTIRTITSQLHTVAKLNFKQCKIPSRSFRSYSRPQFHLESKSDKANQSNFESAKVISKTTAIEGKFLRFVNLTYERKGQIRVCRLHLLIQSNRFFIHQKWESAERTTRKGEVDAVAIIALLRDKEGDLQIILTKQFRPPVSRMCLEFPAGLVDANETPEEAALRELYEETGYKGEVYSVFPELVLDPGMTSANVKFVLVMIDSLAPENRKPLQQLDEGEDIQLELVPIEKLFSTIHRFKEEKNYSIDAKLFTFALGLEMGNSSSIEE